LLNESYINNGRKHLRNERAYVSWSSNFIAKLVVNGRKAKKWKTCVQFVAIFHLLKNGKPMTNFEHMKNMFHFLKVHHLLNLYLFIFLLGWFPRTRNLSIRSNFAWRTIIFFRICNI
jgi:hypothetical protein